MTARRWATIALSMGLVVAACSTDTGITVVEAPETEVEEVPSPTPEPPTPEPATPEPAPTQTPTPEPPTPEPPTPTPEPPPPPTGDPVAALGDIRGVADLPPGAVAYVEFVEVADNDTLITLSAPVEWSDVDGSQWEPNEDGVRAGPAITVSPDVAAWRDTWGTPGVFIAASDQLGFATPAELLDDNQFAGSCDFDSRRPYDDGVYVGEFDVWVNCGDEGSVFIVIAAQPEDDSYLVLVEIVVVSESDWDATATVVASFLAYIE